MKVVKLIKMCLNETYNKVGIGKHLWMRFLLRMVSNKEMLCRYCFSTSP